MTANREIKSLVIADELLLDKEMLEDYLITTLNKVIHKATNINETELAAVAKKECLIYQAWIYLNKKKAPKC